MIHSSSALVSSSREQKNPAFEAASLQFGQPSLAWLIHDE